MSKKAIVITTISSGNKALELLSLGAKKNNLSLIIIGDKKSPDKINLKYADYYTLKDQVKIFPQFCSVLPINHYARKNLGYLIAIKQKVEIIQETDDDNIPLDSFWDNVNDSLTVDEIIRDYQWFNIYQLFTDINIWPRGYPLEFIKIKSNFRVNKNKISKGLIIQGLVDDNTDVDAIYRLTQDTEIKFKKRSPVMLSPYTWCPFNSQNTIFKKEAFPLLYLPSNCSFRMTDIWRSFIAQRCLWELDEGVLFLSPTTLQDRNIHNLLKDFTDEIPGYLNNDRIRKILEECKLKKDDMLRNLIICYDALVANKIFPAEELTIVKSWCKEIEKTI